MASVPSSASMSSIPAETSTKILASTKQDEKFFQDRVGYQPGADFKGVKFVENDECLAMVGYDYWTLNAVHVHIWIGSTRALKGRVFLREIFRFPFEIGGRGIVIAYTPAHNVASLKLQQFLGFKESARIRDGWAIGDDMIISELRKESCVWLRPINEQNGKSS